MSTRLASLNLRPGRHIGNQYVIDSIIGNGSEGEVYKICEVDTGIHRAAKIYYPDQDPKRSRSIRHAQKLNALRHCSIALQYHHTETVRVGSHRLKCLISDFCDGEPLEQWLSEQRGKRIAPFMGLHLLYELACGLEDIHAAGEYHSDVHSQNILISRRGIRFEMKLIDFYDWGRPTIAKQQQDVRDAIAVFNECLGGWEYAKNLSGEVKFIIGGMRRQKILDRFPTMSALRYHLDIFEWE